MKMMMFIIGVLEAGLSMASPVKSSLAAAGSGYSSTLIPPESAFVQYLESTGTQYINLPIASATNLTVSIRCVATKESQYSRYVWGYPGGSGTKKMGILSNYSSGKYWFWWCVDGISNWQRFPVPNTTEQTICLSPSNAICEVAGETVYESAHTGWKYVGEKSSIFSLGNTSGYMGQFRIFSLQMYRGNDLVLDLYPIRFPNEDGEQEGGMYDAVSDKILRNSGKGKFLYGKDIAPFQN